MSPRNRFEFFVKPSVDAMRFLLWIDAVGGYWVCGGNEVMIGQPSPGDDVDLPILADLSRRHAIVRRDGEGYLLQPLREVRLNGVAQTTPAWLTNGSVIELGSAVKLQFTRPHPLSATARLDFLSRHRTSPPTDGVLLLAETCVLGPRESSHVVCRNWTKEIVLHRQGSQLLCRGPREMLIGDEPTAGRGVLDLNSRVTGDDFSFSLEAV